MNWFNNLKIGKKLTVGFGGVEVLMIGLGIFCMFQLAKVNSSTVDIANNWLPSGVAIAELRFDATATRKDTLNYMLATDKREHYSQKVQSDLAELRDDVKKYEPLISSDEERGIYQNFRTNWDRYSAVNTQVMQLVRQNKNAEATKVMQDEGSTPFEEAAKYLEQDVVLNPRRTKTIENQLFSVTFAFLGVLCGLNLLNCLQSYACTMCGLCAISCRSTYCRMPPFA